LSIKKNSINMRRVFGKKKAEAPAPSLDQASSGLGGRIDGMDKKIEGLEGELRGYKDRIKKTTNPAAKKQLQKRALEVLKRKRMYENQRDCTAGQQFNIDQTNFSLESAKASITTVAAMKAANVELKRTLKKDLDIDNIDGLADDMAELMDDFNEINEALGRNFATPDDLDEADLDAELDMLGDELEGELEQEAAESMPSYLLPAQPNNAPGQKLPVAADGVDEFGLPSAPIGNR
jgi:charged multivesicular body protein 5